MQSCVDHLLWGCVDFKYPQSVVVQLRYIIAYIGQIYRGWRSCGSRGMSGEPCKVEGYREREKGISMKPNESAQACCAIAP